MADLGVFMVGGRRTGKTTILASMTKNTNDVTQGTNLVLTAAKMGQFGKLVECVQNLESYFEYHKQDFFTADLGPTFNKDIYIFNLRTTAQKKDDAVSIGFTDVPGEWFENKPDENGYSIHEDEIREILDGSQVIIIAIDTPALMEDKNEMGVGKRHNKYNRVTEITEYIKENVTSDENRMVLFVPLKCETYYHKTYDRLRNPAGRNYMIDINKAVKKGYEDLIAFLTCPNMKDKCTVAITPIITVGGMDFYEFEENGQDVKKQIFYVRDDGKYDSSFCEQPMLYTLAFAVKEFHRTLQKTSVPNLWERFLRRIMRKRETTDEINKLAMSALNKNINDGYEIIQNPLNI